MPTAAEEMEARPDSAGVASIGRSYFAAVAARDVDAMAAHWEPGGIDELHGLASLRAPEEVKEWFDNTFRAVPDFKMEVLHLIAEGERVAVHWHLTGTFSGDARFEGAIATGAKIDLTGCDVLTVRDGKIFHNDAYMNGMQMARQLGVLPAQGSGQERAMIGAVNMRTRLARKLRR
jgi:predicted ester cyclase